MADHDTATCSACKRYGVDAAYRAADYVKVRGEDRLVAEITGEDEVVEARPTLEPGDHRPPTDGSKLTIDRSRMHPVADYLQHLYTREREWLAAAYQLAAFSPDPSTQNGAFLVDERAFGPITYTQTHSVNTFPRGVDSSPPERWVRPAKYAYIEHAERNAIYAAARYGIKTQGLTLVVAWGACADCARAIIQAGIRRVVCHDLGEVHGAWDESITRGMTMLAEAKVGVCRVFGKIPEAPLVLRDGKLVRP